ncbi:2-dehydropantoate 2-reductase N-terminal domain-containing protein [Streptomyces sp. DSM 41982]|uniref:2-dehydropantoate 2-reductase N-terminal domain-containing protein n=2 Tax=Streptomyces TaxID=1883 RepID=A0ABD5DZY1_9ACTN|nr:2-dehydropantoate 2-reductase N-terminal domain-containing protein [Streptomyces sp. DSM 41982]MDT0414644.1 2-dehydropantoate 2-reductase N-terminal domain-containing protein [Streptomyces sp. DSM 41982]
MRYIVVGTGAVGGTVGARLAGSGREVVCVARGAHREALERDGLRLVTPEGEHVERVRVVGGPEELGELRADDVLLLAVKSQDTVAALDAWAPRPVAGGGTAGERLPVLCLQNGVANERTALRRFARVVGVCVWLPSTFLEAGVVGAGGDPLTGILHLGAYPPGRPEPVLEAVAADLRASRFDAPLPADVMPWKYGKLLDNLPNAIEALTGPVEGPDALALVDEARAEGIAVLEAAGIATVGEEEARAARGERMRLLPVPGVPRGGGSTWQSLKRGAASVEADWLNGEIVLLGRLHGVPTPVNETLRTLVNELARTGGGPGARTPAEVRERIARAAGE